MKTAKIVRELVMFRDACLHFVCSMAVHLTHSVTHKYVQHITGNRRS